MTKIIGITGGKGGTGKSTIATAIASELALKHRVLLIDADVDCPNDHLLLGIKRSFYKNVMQRIPSFNFDSCLKCGECGHSCTTKAIVSIEKKVPFFFEERCNGCGACKIICPANCINWNEKIIGKIYFNSENNLDLLSGELKPNEPVSEFIVNALILEIKKNYDFVIIDTAAGTHCPVIAALEVCDQIISVTESTPLGVHDLEIILNLSKKLNKNNVIIVNKSNLGNIELIKKLAYKYKTKIITEILFSKKIFDDYSNGVPIRNSIFSKIVEGLK